MIAQISEPNQSTLCVWEREHDPYMLNLSTCVVHDSLEISRPFSAKSRVTVMAPPARSAARMQQQRPRDRDTRHAAGDLCRHVTQPDNTDRDLMFCPSQIIIPDSGVTTRYTLAADNCALQLS